MNRQRSNWNSVMQAAAEEMKLPVIRMEHIRP